MVYARRRFVSRRADAFGESVIRQQSRLAREFNAVNLAHGFPDFDHVPESVKRAAREAIDGGRNQYAITWGAPELRAAISEKLLRENGISANPDRNVTVACGTTEAMMAACQAVFDPGDEALVFTPFYENYGPHLRLAGASPRFFPLADDLTTREEALKDELSRERMRAVVLNTPHNPTGKVFSREELRLVADLCEDYDLLAITDEIYEHITFDGAAHHSMAAMPGMEDRTVTIMGFSKSYGVTGWRVGYAVAPPEITTAIRKLHDFLTVGAPAPLQHACVAALALPPSYYATLRAMYDAKRRTLVAALEQAGFGVTLPQGAYYVWTDISAFGLKDGPFAEHLVRNVGVLGVRGAGFFDTEEEGAWRYRFTFSKSDETLAAGIARLSRLRETLDGAKVPSAAEDLARAANGP